MKHSDETKKKISQHWHKYFETNDVWNKDKKNCFDDETINRMRIAN